MFVVPASTRLDARLIGRIEEMDRNFRIVNRKNSVGKIVQSFARAFKTGGKSFKDWSEVVFLREPVSAGSPIIRAANVFVVAQVREASPFAARTNAIGKDP